MNEKEKELESLIALYNDKKATDSPTEYHETVPCPPIPAEFESPMAYLRHLAHEGILQRYGSSPSAAAIERMNRELDLIEKKGWQDYFLFIWDLIKTAQDTIPSFLVSAGQGNASNYMITYLLNITQANPFDFHLPVIFFWREEARFPNFTLHIDHASYHAFIHMMKQKYGKRVAPILTRNEYHKGQVSNINVSNYSWAIANKNIDSIMPMIEIYDFRNKENVMCPVYDCWRISEHGAKHLSISGRHHQAISVFQKVLAELKIFYADKQKFLNAIPLNDPETLQSFRLLEKKEVSEIFWAWNVDRELLTDFPIDSFQDLVAYDTLIFLDFTPERSLAHEYMRRKTEGVIPPYMIPDMATVLDETYGLLMYAEQIVLLVNTISNMDIIEAASMLEAIQRKKTDTLREYYYPLFLEGGTRNGYTQQPLEDLFNMLCSTRFRMKSHFLNHALLHYWAAYLRVHYPEAWQKAHQKEEQPTK